MRLLVKFDGNWADEMDIRGFFITTQEDWDEFVARTRKYFETNSEHHYYVGTNEECIYESADDLLHDFNHQEITDEEVAVFVKFFGSGYSDRAAFGFTGPEDIGL